MKHILQLTSFLLLLAMVFSTCELPEQDNPWDENTKLDPDSWAPEKLTVEDISITSRKISWSYSGDTRIEGFLIKRKENQGNWGNSIKISDNQATEWVDKNIVPDTAITYTYQLVAIAGVNQSTETSTSVKVTFPGPTNLSVGVSNDTIVNFTWDYSATGHEGFKIDKRKANEAWQTGYSTLSNDLKTYTDNEKTLPEHPYYYRVYAYYKNYSSVPMTDSIIFPTVTTTTPSQIETTSAIGGGTVTSGANVTARGVVWSTSQNPTVSLTTKTNNGAGTGLFTSSLTGLLPSTTYYVRAYATNNFGTAYGNQVSFTTATSTTMAVLTTSPIINLTTNSATSGGNITSDGGASITARGVVWSTSQNPTVSLSTKTNNGTGTGSFSSSLTGLSPSTTYYVRAYATSLFGTAYGNQVSFTTNGQFVTTVVEVLNPLTIKTWMDRNLGSSRAATSRTDSQAYGDLYQWGRDSDGHEKRTSQTTSSLSSSDTPGHGNFITVSSGNYDWRSPQNNNLWQGVNGTNNPCPEGFRIPTIAEWEAERASWSSNNSAGAFASPLKLPVAGGRDDSNGSLGDVGSFGYYWSGTRAGSGAQGLGFGSSDAFVYSTYRARGVSVRCIKDAAVITLPTLSTSSISGITTSSANSGGNITSDGGASITARGVVWSTSQNPTVSLSTKTSNGSGTGSFTSSLTGLSASTTYYVRAYATNIFGTSYGNEISFTTNTPVTVPVISTSSINYITTSSASSGGNISSDGGASVTDRGVVWSASQNPTVSLSTKTSNGTGTGSFTSSLTGLSASTTYYVRAYATNNAGTAYGNQLSFTTTATSTVSTVTSTTGKVWMDRNLGASRAATSSTDSQSYGDLYQWGRDTDGHEKRTSPTTTSLSNSNSPGHGNFITVSSGNYDWRSPQNNDLWQGVNGTNNPCPEGFRIPTSAEWEAERAIWSNNTSAGAFATPLKLPKSGVRYNSSGSLLHVGAIGFYWSVAVNGTNSQRLSFDSGSAGVFDDYRAHGFSVRCIKEVPVSIVLPSITTASVSNITSTLASSGGNISSDGGASVTARGVCWSTSQNPTVSLSTKTTDGSGTGTFSSSITGLQSGTTYYVRAYATNSVGTSYGSQVSFTTTSAPAVSTVTSATGKVWMDRNLGSSRVATFITDSQAYGDLYQWGRDSDGHEKRTSQTTSSLSSNDIPGHGKFINAGSGSIYDWRSPQNNNLWQGENGINNPCPEGFSIPTAAEWEAERASWSSYTSSGAFASPLKLPLSGYRYSSNGSLYSEGSYGYYWSETVNGSYAQALYLGSDIALIDSNHRAYGNSVRCLKN